LSGRRSIPLGVLARTTLEQAILQLYHRYGPLEIFQRPEGLELIAVGWLTVIGWIAALTSTCFFVSDLVLQLATLNNPDTYVRENWHTTLLLWAVLMLCVFINVFISGALPTIEVVVLVMHVLGFFGILVPLVYLSPYHNTAKTVFTTFNNKGQWPTQALAFFVGLQGNALAFVGTDSVVHVSMSLPTSEYD
jgi:choline transport protein